MVAPVQLTMAIKSVQSSSSMWPLSCHVCIKNQQRKHGLLGAGRFVWNVMQAGTAHDKECINTTRIEQTHRKKKHQERSERVSSTYQIHRGLCTVGHVGPTEEQSSFSSLTPGRRPNSAPYEGVRFLFALCCDHSLPTYNSQPFNFNAAVMSLLWSIVHV